MTDRNERLYETWDERWKGSEDTERLTALGRLMFRAKRRALAPLVREFRPSSVLEVGCGLGHILQMYHELGPELGMRCRGIDVSPTAVRVCRAKGLAAELRNVEDVTEERGWDWVSSDGMLEHFLHFEPMARQLMRLSSRHVFIIQPNHESLTGKSLVFLAEILRGDDIVFEYNYRMRDFVAVFGDNGFALERSVPVFGDVFRFLLFRRGGA